MMDSASVQHTHGFAISRRDLPEVCCSITPSPVGGRRESRMRAGTRGPVCNIVGRGAHEHTGPAETSDFPCAAVYGLYMLSSVSPALLPPSSARERELDTSHWGVGTTRLRRPLQMPSSVAPSASTASPPRAGTLRNAPSSGTGCETYNPVSISGKQKYFCAMGLTRFSDKPK